MHIKKEKLYPFMSYLNFLVERLACGHCCIGLKQWIKKMASNLRIPSIWMCWKRSGGNRLISLKTSLKNRKVKKNNNNPRWFQKVYSQIVPRLQIPYQKNQTLILMIFYKNNKSKLSQSQKSKRSRRLTRNWSLQRKKKKKRKSSINIYSQLNQKSWTLTIRFEETVL